MAKLVSATKKNSPAIHQGANRDNKPASDYAAPHDMSGVTGADLSNNGYGSNPKRADDNEICVSVGPFRNKPYPTAKTDGITMRGHGAAVKGIKSRGPMG